MPRGPINPFWDKKHDEFHLDRMAFRGRVFCLCCVCPPADACVLSHKCAIDVLEARRYFNSLQQKKMEIDEEKVKFAEEAQEIFALYDMTKELSKNFSEDDSIRIFKAKLSDSVRCDECRFVLPAVEEKKTIPQAPEGSVIPLIAQQQLLGICS